MEKHLNQLVKPVLSNSAEITKKPIMGEHYARVYDFITLKRAMICFLCEMPFFISLMLIFAFAYKIEACIIATLIFAIVNLLALIPILSVKVKFKSAGALKLNLTLAISIIGLVFCLLVPTLLLTFICGVVYTVKMKRWFGDSFEAVSKKEEKIIAEQESYFEKVEKYRFYVRSRRIADKENGK